MAEATEETTEGTEEKAGKSRTIMLGVIILAAVGASIGGTLMFVGSDEPQAVEAEEAVTSNPKAIYHNLRPAFIVNFIAGNKPRYLQAEVTVMSRDQEVIEGVINHTPLIRSRVVNFLADQDYLALQTHEGRETLRTDLRKVIEDVLLEESSPSGIETILLNNFVMQ